MFSLLDVIGGYRWLSVMVLLVSTENRKFSMLQPCPHFCFPFFKSQLLQGLLKSLVAETGNQPQLLGRCNSLP
jgi:hypothetical protein